MGIFSFLTGALGATSSMKKRFELLAKKLVESNADNHDHLESLKDRIKQLEAQLIQKKKEWEQAKGPSRRIVGTEIELLFRDLDRLQGREKIIVSNIERISIGQAKIEEALIALDKGVDEDELTDIMLENEGLYDDLKAADRAARDLEKTKYETPWDASKEAEARLSEINGEKETISGLSVETEKKLRELEKD